MRADPGAATFDSDMFVAKVKDVRQGWPPKNITNNPAAIGDDRTGRQRGKQLVFTSHARKREPDRRPEQPDERDRRARRPRIVYISIQSRPRTALPGRDRRACSGGHTGSLARAAETPAADEDEVSGGARSAPTSLPHLWKGRSATVAVEFTCGA